VGQQELAMNIDIDRYDGDTGSLSIAITIDLDPHVDADGNIGLHRHRSIDAEP
jgi:hypothetical protein